MNCMHEVLLPRLLICKVNGKHSVAKQIIDSCVSWKLFALQDDYIPFTVRNMTYLCPNNYATIFKSFVFHSDMTRYFLSISF